MQLTLLHSEQVEASRAIVAELGGEPTGEAITVNKDGREVRIVSGHSSAVGVCPNFSAYPAFAVLEDSGQTRVKSPVASWTECLDFADTPPSAEETAKPAEFARLEFLRRFTDAELVQLKSLETTDPTVALFWEEYRSAETIRLDDPRTIQALDYLVAQGYITLERKVAVLAP